MQNKIIDGKSTSDHIIIDVNREITEIMQKSQSDIGYQIGPPTLAVILVGNNPASESYVKNKVKACDRAGINHMVIRFDESISTLELINEVNKLNESHVDGFIVQLPLPKHINVEEVINSIDPNKDVDGFHPLNFGKMALGQPSMKPATPYGILKLIKHNKIETKGKHVVVIGRSNIVGKPLSIMLGNDFSIGRATVTSCDINTPKELLLDELKRADIIIIAIGVPYFLTGDMVKKGVVIIDVGINKVDKGIVGDVDFDSVIEKCSLITPVPGGVGPMTISALIVNTLNSWKRKYNIAYKVSQPDSIRLKLNS
jgi:methylenetetrahydrofolate dehydrogenase (NADP+)/methenyltetrahydrofolate cyclohydrolase